MLRCDQMTVQLEIPQWILPGPTVCHALRRRSAEKKSGKGFEFSMTQAACLLQDGLQDGSLSSPRIPR